MGYTHYWYRPKEIRPEVFKKIVDDFKKLLPIFKMLDVQLAGPLGEGEPIINYEEVSFNGNHNCGHPKIGLGIAWPDDNVRPGVAISAEGAISGSWFAGALLNQRTCGGDCSHETFSFPRRLDEKEKPLGEVLFYDEGGNPIYTEKEKVGKYFDFCKTAFKPYDLAVNAFLIIAKHYLGRDLIVESDGDIPQWIDAIELCQSNLGYGRDFVLGVPNQEEWKEERKIQETLDPYL